MGWANNATGHKRTMSCPQEGCSYKSRQFIKEPTFHSDPNKRRKKKNAYYNSSQLCPLHRKELVYKPEVNGRDMKAI